MFIFVPVCVTAAFLMQRQELYNCGFNAEIRESTRSDCSERSYQQVRVRGGACRILGSRVDLDGSPYNVCGCSALTGSLPLFQKSLAGDVIMVVFCSFCFIA